MPPCAVPTLPQAAAGTPAAAAAPPPAPLPAAALQRPRLLSPWRSWPSAPPTLQPGRAVLVPAASAYPVPLAFLQALPPALPLPA
eukprot:scaffold40754_cov13-Tisochrysis_lutea.AAC.1